MHRVREALKLCLLVVALLACNRGSCSRPSVKVKVGELPVDALDAARELGKAAATEKDADKLASKIAAFLERLSFPVVSMDGEKLVVKGYMSFPPKRGFLWEPLLAGVARATVKGDRRPSSVVWRTFVPKATREQLSDIDMTSTFLEAAKDVAEKKGNTIDAMLVTAIAKDLETRGATEADPWLDPTATLLLGLWVSLAAEKAQPGLEPGMPASAPGMPQGIPGGIPGLPPGFKLPRAPNALTGPASLPSCGFMEKAAKAAEALGTATEWGSKVGGWLSDNPIFANVNVVVKQVGDTAAIPKMIAEAISGMGIAAFLDVTGEVSPKKVKYGDGPVTYKVHVESVSPFTKAQLDSFVSCLQATNPASTAVLEPLRDLPPKGAIGGIPVYWEGTGAIDPKHGKLTPGNASVPSGLVDQVVKAGMGAAGGSVTDSSGNASAKFQVKPSGKGPSQGTSRVETFTVMAWVFPFPIGGSVVYGGSNVVSNRSVPLALEIEVPLPTDWVMGFKENLFATGAGISGGWSIDMDATVPFSLGPNLDFDGKGSGTWSFGFKGSAEGVTCSAPTDKHSFDVSARGKVQNVDTMSTHFTLSDATHGAINSTLTCRGPGGISVSAPMRGPASGSIVKGTPVERFDMPLRDGQTKSWPVTHGSARGTAKITLTAKDAP